jgi:peroxiredoxin
MYTAPNNKKENQMALRKGIFVVVLAGMAGAVLYTRSAAEEPKARIDQKAPDFALKDYHGKEFKLSEYRGKIVVLEWVNQDCPVTRRVHQQDRIQDTYRSYAEKGVVWIGIDTTDAMPPERNRVYAARMGLAFPILHDTDGKVGRAYGAKTTPHMFIIDREGKLVYDGAWDDDPNGQKEYEGKSFVSAALDALLADRPIENSKNQPYGCSVKYPRAEAG